MPLFFDVAVASVERRRKTRRSDVDIVCVVGAFESCKLQVGDKDKILFLCFLFQCFEHQDPFSCAKDNWFFNWSLASKK